MIKKAKTGRKLRLNKVLKKDIQMVVESIKAKYHPEKIILFGSAARGEFEEGSDLDFFIIKKTKLPRHHRPSEIYKFLDERDLPMDFIIYTPREFKERLSLGDFFIKRILKEGKVLYGK